jgi:tetratricopeptide (TPR) repeat protein
MEYAQAERDFRHLVEAEPQSAAAINHLLTAELFSALNQAGALNTSAYASNHFLALKKQVKLDTSTRSELRSLMQRALRISDARLASHPNDADALYDRGVTRALNATYQALVEHSWYSALRLAVGARRDHQRVLELNPARADAKTIVGMHTYIAGSLPWTMRTAAVVVGFSGNKERGLKMLREAAAADSESSIDAKVALALFLRREEKYDEALEVVRSLIATYPRNFLFALEEANLLKDMGSNQAALDAFTRLVARVQHGAFAAPRIEFAYYGLGEMHRGRHEYSQAAEAYEAVLGTSGIDPELRQRTEAAIREVNEITSHRAQQMNDSSLP